MSARLPDHAKGLLLAAFGGTLLTFDIPVLRLADGEAWSVMLLRSGFVVLFVVIYVGLRKGVTGRFPVIVPGRVGWIVAALYGSTATTFLISVFNTSTANLVFILAFNPMFAALLSWLFLGERPRPATLAAMAVMAAGVLIIVEDGLGQGTLLGDAMAVVSSLAIAGAITLTRASGMDMSFTPMIGALAPLLLALVMVVETGFQVAAPGWLVINGLLIIPFSFFCLALAPRYLTGSEVAMFYLLETVFAPVWVWIIFSEAPTPQSALGGGLLLFTLILHSLWQLYSRQRRRAAKTLRRPV